MEILSIENLTFTYPKTETSAVENVSLQVGEGDFVLLCGASGCGKTTLLKLLKRELTPSGEQCGNGICSFWCDDGNLCRKIGRAHV